MPVTKHEQLASMHAGPVVTQTNACWKKPFATLCRLLLCHCLSIDTEHASCVCCAGMDRKLDTRSQAAIPSLGKLTGCCSVEL